jgi:molybdopterin-guanine dinucleotide biosynthesis protein A
MTNPTASAVILAGGKSTRLGRDKASELLLGVSLLQRVVTRVEALVDEAVVVRAAEQVLPRLTIQTDLRIVEDVFPDAGPLGGIYSGLSDIRTQRALVVACDMPLLQPALLSELLRLASEAPDAVVPLNDAGLPEPLCAVYSTSCIAAIREHLDAGTLKATSFLDDVRVRYLAPSEWRRFDPNALSFLNVNREEDLRRAEALLASALDHDFPLPREGEGAG